jgi:hypothetical protein
MGRGFHDPYHGTQEAQLKAISASIRRKAMRETMIDLIVNHHGVVDDFRVAVFRCDDCGKILNPQHITMNSDLGVYETRYACCGKAMTEIPEEQVDLVMKNCPRCDQSLSIGLSDFWD